MFKILNGSNMNCPISQNTFGVKKKMSNYEKTKILTESAIETLRQRIIDEVPPYGGFKTVKHLFDIPGTQNEAVFAIKHPLTAPMTKRVLTIGAKKQASDKEIYNVLAAGDLDEIKNVLKNANCDELALRIKDLSEEVDEIYDNL